jgi:2-succinyl-5-enolpyruvyl-6-hydroxy-3-cyclohexene-1-carboxylate synthase
LPGHEESETFNTFFETSHCLTAEHLAKMYRFEYFTASDTISLSNAMQQLFVTNNQPAILEVFTPTRENDKLLKHYFNKLV